MDSRDSFLTRLHARRTTLRRAVLRRRRLLAVLCTAGAVGAGLHAAAPPDAPTATMLVAARDLPAGTTLGAGEVDAREVPPDVVPDGALTGADAAGAVLASPLRAGEPVTEARLVGAGLADADPGTVAMPVRLSDAAQAGLLTVGDAVDLLATDPESRSTVPLATGVVVLAVPDVRSDAPDALTGRLVVLGIPASEVGEVAGAAVTSFVTYAWTSR